MTPSQLTKTYIHTLHFPPALSFFLSSHLYYLNLEEFFKCMDERRKEGGPGNDVNSHARYHISFHILSLY